MTIGGGGGEEWSREEKMREGGEYDEREDDV
jgi:hypothetical protein